MDRETVELAVHNSLGLQTGARSAREDQIIMREMLPKQSQGLFVPPPSLYLVQLEKIIRVLNASPQDHQLTLAQ